MTIVGNISFTNIKWEGQKCNTNLFNQILSQVGRDMHPLQVYKTKFSRNYCCASLDFFKGFVALKYDVIAHPGGLDHLFPNYWLWFITTATSFSTMANFLWATNFGCVDSTWVLMGVIPLILPYLIKVFSYNRMLAQIKNINLFYSINNAPEHLWLLKIHKYVVIYNKKRQ